MKPLSSLALVLALLALGACSTMPDVGLRSERPIPAPAGMEPAPTAQEQDELATVMGADKNAPAKPQKTEKETETAPAPEPKGCPAVEVLPDTKSITNFVGKNGYKEGRIAAQATLSDVQGACTYKDGGVAIDIDMVLAGRIEDSGRYNNDPANETVVTFPYFLAIMDPKGNMMDKKILATALRFPANEKTMTGQEKISQFLPLPELQNGADYVIAIGFQLTRDQLTFNRGGSRGAELKASTPAKTEAPSLPDKAPVAPPAKEPAAEMTKAQETQAPVTQPAVPAATPATNTPTPRRAPMLTGAPQDVPATPAPAPNTAPKTPIINNNKMQPVF